MTAGDERLVLEPFVSLKGKLREGNEWRPDRIRTIREVLELSQAEFAEKVGVSRKTVVRWESGRAFPFPNLQLKLEDLAKIAIGLEVPYYTPDETRRIREKYSWTQGEFARKIGVTQQLVSLWESGVRIPSTEYRIQLANLAEQFLQQNVPSKKSILQNEQAILQQNVPFNSLHYDTNRWGECKWVMVQAYKQSDLPAAIAAQAGGDWSKRRRWKWWPVEKLESFRKQHNSTLVFNTIGHFQKQDKMSPQIENLCFDFDAKDSVEFELARLSVISISRYFWDYVPGEAIRYWFTGGRSFHIEIPYQVFGIEPQPELNLIMKHLAMYINQHLKESDDPSLPVDESIYSNPRMWRMPNSFYPKYDAWKIEMSYEEVFKLSEKEIRELAKEPRPPLYDLSQLNYESIPEAVEWYKERLQEYHELKEERQHVPVNPRAFVSLSGIPDCMADLRQNTIKKAGERNRATMLDATFCLQTGVKLEDAQEIINEWVQRIPDGLTGCKSGRERENATKSVVNYIYDNKEKYKFGCGYAKVLGLACSEEDCPLYNAIAFQKWGKRVKVIENFQPNSPIQRVHSEDGFTCVNHVDEARELYRKDIKNFLGEPNSRPEDKILYSEPNSEIRIPSARFYDMIQGTGKSVTGIMTLDALRRHTIYGAPRHDIISDLLPLTSNEMDWKHILPRGPVGEKPKGATDEQIKAWEATALCPLFKRANALAAKRWNVAKYLCAYNCLIGKPNCQWWLQFKNNGSSAIVHEYFFMPTIFEWLACQKDDRQANEKNPVVVFDEPNPNTFIETVNVTATTLTTEIARTRSTDVRELLKILRRAVEKVSESLGEAKDSKRIMGKAVMSAIFKVTPPDIDLGELIENSKSALCYPETFVEVTAETILDATDNAYLAIVDSHECWIPKKFEVAVGTPSRFMVPLNFAEEKGIPYKDDFDLTAGLPAATTAQAGEGVPLNFAEDLVACLQRDFESYSEGKNYNSPLVITKHYGEPCIRMNLRKFFAVPPSLPLLLMDGSGDAELLAELIRRPVERWTIPMRPDVRTPTPYGLWEVIQIVDGSYGITTLFKKDTTDLMDTRGQDDTKPYVGEPKRTFFRLLKAVKQIAASDPEGTVIITWKIIETVLRDLQAKGEIDSRIAIDHYGNVEGSNIYEEKRQVILFGTPCPQPEDLLELAHAIWADSDEPLDVETIKDGNWRPYQYREEETGLGYAVEVREYKDRRLNLLLHTYREQEIVQAAHRIRPILTPGKNIYLLTNIPLDELPPTKVTTVRELIGDTDFLFLAFKEVVKRIVKDYSGACGELLWLSKQCNKIYNLLHPLDSQNFCRATIFNWLNKAAKQLGYVATTVTFPDLAAGRGNVNLKVWHNGSLDENRIRKLYESIRDKKSDTDEGSE